MPCASIATKDDSPSAMIAWTSPMDSRAPGTRTGRYTVEPGRASVTSMFPPSAYAGMIVEFVPVAGATPMQPIIGRTGNACRSVTWTTPSSIGQRRANTPSA